MSGIIVDAEDYYLSFFYKYIFEQQIVSWTKDIKISP